MSSVDKQFDEAMVERLAKAACEAEIQFFHALYPRCAPMVDWSLRGKESKGGSRSAARAVLTALSETHVIVPKAKYEAMSTILHAATERDRWQDAELSPDLDAQTPEELHASMVANAKTEGEKVEALHNALRAYYRQPKTCIDGDNIILPQCEWVRVKDENDVLWAIFKTCPGCKRLVPGVVYDCDIQHHIDLSGNCNQREEMPLNRIADLMQQFVTLMGYMTPSRLPDNYNQLQHLMNQFAEVLGEVRSDGV